MGQHGQRSDAALMDAKIKSSKKDYALSTGQSANEAVMMDAQIKLRREEYALGTEQTATTMMNL
jgi:hypothetical protein